jgi:lipopolysaccharide transport system permease protein
MNTFTDIIKPRKSIFDIRLKDVWDYRDLVLMFVKRDFAAQYKQTILGPLWFFVQPLLTTIMFTVVFGNIGKISTDGMPKMLFYLCGLTIWNYFAECFNRTSTVFLSNAGIFGKVYFPRLVSPLAIVISGLLRFGVQLLMFLGFWIYYIIQSPDLVQPKYEFLWLFPFLILYMAGFALGFGMIISSLTTKYKDLVQLISFGVTLLMYATPIIYPVSSLPERYQVFVNLNPLAPVVESFRNIFLGTASIEWLSLCISGFVMLFIILIGILFFNKVERTFMDTV